VVLQVPSAFAEVAQRADRLGADREAIRQPSALELCDALVEEGDGQGSRELVVGERRMARVRREEHLLVGLPGKHCLADLHAAGPQLGVHHDLVVALRKLLDLPVRHAEAPALLVEARDVRDRVGLLGQGVEVGPQLLERERPAKRHGVRHQMEVVLGEVGTAPAVGADDVGLVHHPLVRDGPVERAVAARDGDPLHRHQLGQDVERLAYPGARDAAVDRPEAVEVVLELRGQVVHGAGKLARAPGGAAESARTRL
jgi:hypothetical protein